MFKTSFNKKISLFLFTYFVLPINVFALDYVPLSGDNSPLGSLKTNDVNTLLDSLFKWGISIAVILATLVLIWGGFLYMTTDAVGKKEDGKNKIKGALGGLILALSSWAILNTINPTILSTPLDFSGLRSEGDTNRGISTDEDFIRNIHFQAEDRRKVNEFFEEEKRKEEERQALLKEEEAKKQGLIDFFEGDSNKTLGENSDSLSSLTTQGQEEYSRNYLSSEGFTFNRPVNTDDSATAATHIRGVKKGTADQLISLKNEYETSTGLNNSWNITGGSEQGHSTQTYSHANGYKIDIGQSSPNYNEIKSFIKTKAGTTSNSGSFTLNGKTVNFLDEGDHLDLKFLPN